ncbi:MAG: VOC family protein [Anaerolineales bacterium]|nr:VOC family protein [Anaerolineales bacterium]MCB0013513.1 VOC family protein [Anaerolineales bacterium]MCB0018415.1 VOC family protein [Anaerolineales bacterium]MCB8959935.1 VOC family protein [Ardenticatenales bacterium]
MNRSMPPGTFIPELPYPDVTAAVRWLCATFGFVERLRIGNHRAQLVYEEGSLIVTQGAALPVEPAGVTIMVRVPDVDAHFAHTQASGAQIITPPTNHPYGERQYVVADPGGHHWVFSQTVADIDPATWGGQLMV